MRIDDVRQGTHTTPPATNAGEHSQGGHPHVVSLAEVTPGTDVVIETVAPPVHDGAGAALHEGLVVHCRARGPEGVVLEVPGHGPVVVPEESAHATWVRLPPLAAGA